MRTIVVSAPYSLGMSEGVNSINISVASVNVEFLINLK